MTRKEKLAYHLEMVIWETVVPPGVALTAAEITTLVNKATPEQHRAAYERALIRSPTLLDDERNLR